MQRLLSSGTLLLLVGCGADVASTPSTVTSALLSDDETISVTKAPLDRIGCSIDDVAAPFVLTAAVTDATVKAHVENHAQLDREVVISLRLFTGLGVASSTTSAALAVGEATDLDVPSAVLGVADAAGDAQLHVALDALSGGELAPTIVLPVTIHGPSLAPRSEPASPYVVWISSGPVAVPEAAGDSEPVPEAGGDSEP